MKVCFQILIFCLSAIFLNAQNVGIGIAAPTEKLEVAGNIKSSSNVIVLGSLGVNTNSPLYRMHINDGSLALSNTTDNATWQLSYNSSNNYFGLSYNGSTRMAISNTGNVGIGIVSPVHKLDVNGSIGASSAAIDGNLTVNNGFGVLRNGHNSTQLKYYTFTGAFGFTNFPGHTVSGPHQVNFPGAADFTSPPRVMIANYTFISGSAGHLFSIVPAIYSVSNTGFQVYFFNSSTAAATMDFTMSFVCIGN